MFQDPEKVRNLTIQDIHYALKNEKLEDKKALNKTTRDVKPATKTFIGGEDNCADLLLEARFQRYPIQDPSKWFSKMPTKRKAIFKSMPFKFFGGQNRVADSTIVKAHDRTICLQLKHYLTENSNVASKPKKEYKKLDETGVALITDDWWESAGNLSSVQAAFDNYSMVLFNLWPYDPTSMILNTLMTNYKWISAAPDLNTSLDIVKAHFNSVLKDNANRAINEEVVMSFDEQETLLKSILARNGLRPELPFNEKRPAEEKLQSDRAAGPKVRKVDNKPRRYLTSAGQETCRLWNNLDGKTVCRNLPSGNGCSFRGKVFPHLCSFYMISKGAICEGGHRRKDHR